MFLFGEFVLLMRAQTTCGSHKTMQDGVTTKAYQQWGGDLNFMVFLNSYGHADVQPAVNAALTAVHNNRASVPWPSGAALEACVCQSRWTFENVVHAGCTSLPSGGRIEARRGPGGHMAPKTSRKSVRCSDQAVRRERALHRTQESGQAQHNRYTMSQGWRRGVSIVPSSLPRASWYVMIPCRADMTPVSALPSLQTHVTRGIRARRLESAQNGTVLVKNVTSGVTCGPNTMLIPPTVGRHIILCPRVAIKRLKTPPRGHIEATGMTTSRSKALRLARRKARIQPLHFSCMPIF